MREFPDGLTVIGGGTMGQGIATAAVVAGLPTTLVDVDATALERAHATVTRRVTRMTGNRAADLLTRLSLSTDLPSAVARTSAVIEAVPELTDLKLGIFAQLAVNAPADAVHHRSMTANQGCERAFVPVSREACQALAIQCTVIYDNQQRQHAVTGQFRLEGSISGRSEAIILYISGSVAEFW